MSRQIHRNIYLISLVLAVGSLPLSRAVLSIATIVLLLNWIVERNFRDKWNLLKKHPIAWLFAGFFLLHLFSGLYTDAPGMFQQDLVVKIPLLIVPLVIISSPPLTVEESKYVFKAMILGGLLATLYCLIIAFDENITHGFTLTRLWNCWWNWGCEDGNAFLNYRYFTYENFSSALSLHPTYFALFLNLSCVFIVWIWRDEWKTYKRFSHIGWAILLVYFFGMILMLSSRMQIINFLIIGLGGLFVYGWKSRRIALSFSLIAVIGFLAGVIILANPQNRDRFLDLFEDEPLEVEEVHHSGSEVRKYIWRTSFNLISESFWLGYGSGDIKDVLKTEYEEQGFDYGVENYMNAHNQFLETWLGTGVVGFLYVCLLFLIPAYGAIKSKNYLYLIFLGLFFLSCLTESFFNRQLGVNFYAFFNAILIFSIPPKTT